ncbi:MAG: hypothetical protein ACREPT_10895 [Rudaea sp.]
MEMVAVSVVNAKFAEAENLVVPAKAEALYNSEAGQSNASSAFRTEAAKTLDDQLRC